MWILCKATSFKWIIYQIFSVNTKGIFCLAFSLLVFGVGPCILIGGWLLRNKDKSKEGGVNLWK
jgi:uncharacterized membrane protein